MRHQDYTAVPTAQYRIAIDILETVAGHAAWDETRAVAATVLALLRRGQSVTISERCCCYEHIGDNDLCEAHRALAHGYGS